MKISWLILTWNRAEAVEKALRHSAANAGREWSEIVWVDNGSDADERQRIERVIGEIGGEVTRVFLPTNRGVAAGYNAALTMSHGDHVVITGCDMKMPAGWLEAMASASLCAPNAGIITIYAQPIEKVPERSRGQVELHGGLALQPAMPIGRRFLSRELHGVVGCLPECFGLYGWEDVAWAHRAERVGKRLGLTHYNLSGYIAESVPTSGRIGSFASECDYAAWKLRQVEKSRPLMAALEGAGWPGFHAL